MAPQWREMVRHAIAEADRLSLQIDLNNDDGWNSGGPWITPEQAMQKLTWSETRVHGPAKLSLPLPQPPTALGTYRDIAVLAIPALEGAKLPAAKRTVGPGPAPWIELAFPHRVSVGSITVTASPPKPGAVRPLRCELQVPNDGYDFSTMQRFETGWVSTLAAHQTVNVGLEAVQGQFFRLLSLGWRALGDLSRGVRSCPGGPCSASGRLVGVHSRRRTNRATWSNAVNGLQARIALKRTSVFNGTPVISSFLELRNVSRVMNPMNVAWDPKRHEVPHPRRAGTRVGTTRECLRRAGPRQT
jgi:hypothetical protein